MSQVGPFTIVIGAYPDTSASLNTPRIAGCIKAVGFASHSNTGDFTITTKGSTQTPAQDILAVSSPSDGWIYPRALAQDAADGSNLTGWYEAAEVDDQITILVENATPGDEFDVTFMVED